MKTNRIIDALQYLDEDLITDAEKPISLGKHSSIGCKAATVAACLVAVVGLVLFSVWMFVPDFNFGVREDLGQTSTFCRMEKYMATYNVEELSRFDQLMWKNRIGDLYIQHGTARFYRLNDSNTLKQLILLESDDAKPKLLSFDMLWVPSSEEYLRESFLVQNGFLNDDDLSVLVYQGSVAFTEVLDYIYGVSSHTDIEKVKFEKSDADHSKIGKRVEVETVVVEDGETLETIYNALSVSIQILSTNSVLDHRVFCESEAYLKGEMPLSAQTERKMILYLKNGETLELLYAPTAYTVCTDVASLGFLINIPTYNTRLIEIAGIDMEYRYHGVNPKNRNDSKNKDGEVVGETATVSALPTT